MNKRVKILATLLSLVLLLIISFGCSSGKENEPTTGETDDQTQQESIELRIIGANHPWMEAIEPLIPEFEEQTGIKINLEKYFEDQLTQKLTTEFTANSDSIDVFMIRPLQEGKLLNFNGWVADIAGYTDDPEWDLEDFTDSSINSLKDEEVIFGIPLVTEREILYYRKDIFEENNIEVPQTLEELEEIAQQLNDPENDFYGIVSRGERAAAVTQFSSYLYGFG